MRRAAPKAEAETERRRLIMPGSIVKRGKNSWSVIVDLGRDPVTGKRRQLWRSVKGSKRDAQVVLTQLLHQRDTGVDAPPGKTTVGEFLQLWLQTYAAPNTAPKIDSLHGSR